MESTPSTASFKRVRPPGSGNRVPSCSVDGCDADLGKCRDYHRRHKVCELHSKTPNVSIRGQERRFCQQCSRFHSLEEFDEGKRSCRKRLDGHNRRRRKPQPDALSVNSGRLLSNPPGTRYLLFNSPQMFSTTSMTDSSIGAMKVETNLSRSLSFSDRNSSFHGSSSLNYKEEKQVSFLEYASSTVPSVPVCQPLVNANHHPSSSNGGRCGEMFSSSGLNQSIECNRALSLLSSQPAETLEIGLNPMVQSGTTSSLVPSVQYEGLGMESGQLGTNLTTNGSTNTNLHGNGVFRTGHPRSSATATQHALSFSWE